MLPETIRRNLPLLLLVAVFAFVSVLGGASVDYGTHWDEGNILWSVQKSAETGLLLPNWYLYPSLAYDIAFLTAAPAIVQEARTANEPFKSTGPAAQRRGAIAHQKWYLLRLRTIFFILSMMAGFAVFALTRALTRDSWAALGAALLVLVSPEFFYHSRWVATDTVLAMLATTAMYLQYRLLTGTSRTHFLRSALWCGVIVGVCIGMKYPGGILVVPLGLAVVLRANREGVGRKATLGVLASSLAVAGIVFLFTTPGAMVDPLRFVRDVFIEIRHYAGGHGGYTVGKGLDHFMRLLRYLATIAFSRSIVLAVVPLGLAVFGAVRLALRDRRVALWLLSLPVLYLLYMSSQRVMIVRNDMIQLPLLAVLAGVGLHELTAAPRRRTIRVVVATALVASIFAVNAVAVTKASLSIRQNEGISPASALAGYLSDRPQTAFALSPGAERLGGRRADAANVVGSVERADRFIFLSHEVPDDRWTVWPANRPGRYTTVWSRGDEVNWDYYPTWLGYSRVLDVSVDDPALRPLIEEVTAAETPRP